MPPKFLAGSVPPTTDSTENAPGIYLARPQTIWSVPHRQVHWAGGGRLQWVGITRLPHSYRRRSKRLGCPLAHSFSLLFPLSSPLSHVLQVEQTVLSLGSNQTRLKDKTSVRGSRFSLLLSSSFSLMLPSSSIYPEYRNLGLDPAQELLADFCTLQGLQIVLQCDVVLSADVSPMRPNHVQIPNKEIHK